MGGNKHIHQIIAVVFIVFGVAEFFSIFDQTESLAGRVVSVLLVSYVLVLAAQQYLFKRKNESEDD